MLLSLGRWTRRYPGWDAGRDGRVSSIGTSKGHYEAIRACKATSPTAFPEAMRKPYSYAAAPRGRRKCIHLTRTHPTTR